MLILFQVYHWPFGRDLCCNTVGKLFLEPLKGKMFSFLLISSLFFFRNTSIWWNVGTSRCRSSEPLLPTPTPHKLPALGWNCTFQCLPRCLYFLQISSLILSVCVCVYSTSFLAYTTQKVISDYESGENTDPLKAGADMFLDVWNIFRRVLMLFMIDRRD